MDTRRKIQLYRRLLRTAEQRLQATINPDDPEHRLNEGFTFWVRQGHAAEELPAIEFEWSTGYQLVAESTGRQAQLLTDGELVRLEEYHLVGLYPEDK